MILVVFQSDESAHSAAVSHLFCCFFLNICTGDETVCVTDISACQDCRQIRSIFVLGLKRHKAPLHSQPSVSAINSKTFLFYSPPAAVGTNREDLRAQMG